MDWGFALIPSFYAQGRAGPGRRVGDRGEFGGRGGRGLRPRPLPAGRLRIDGPTPAAGKHLQLARPIEAQATAVEAVDELPRVRAVEGDDLDDIFPAQGPDLDPAQGRFEPVAEPAVAL